MGNVCCDQEPPRPHHNIRSVNNQRTQQSRQVVKSEKQSRFEQQKTLLLDYSTAINYLSKNGSQGSDIKYKKFAVGNFIASDGVAEYFKGSLVNEGQMEKECVIKKIDKRKFLSKNQKKFLAIQYEITRYLSHSFIVKCCHFYQDQNFLYLYFNLQNYRHLNQFTSQGLDQDLYSKFRSDLENNIRFLIAGIIVGIQILHQLKIVYRGISNENIVILSDGYPLLTNLSKLHPQGYTSSQQAEVNHFTSLQQYRGQILTSATDLWDVGVLIYYICKGKYINFTTFKEKEFKGEDLSVDLIDLVNHLLILNPQERLGAKNINELKSHTFFKNFDWQAYSQKQIVSPLRENDILNTNYQNNQQMKQSEFTYDNSGGYGMMGMMLFMDLATIYMLSQAFDNQGALAQNLRHESQHDLNQQDDFQLATEIDLAADQGFGSGGGDYD